MVYVHNPTGTSGGRELGRNCFVKGVEIVKGVRRVVDGTGASAMLNNV